MATGKLTGWGYWGPFLLLDKVQPLVGAFLGLHSRTLVCLSLREIDLLALYQSLHFILNISDTMDNDTLRGVHCGDVGEIR